MTEANETPETGGHTSWKRFGVFAGVGTVMVGGLLYAMANGAVAAQFVVSDMEFKVSADQLVGHGFEQFGSIVANRENEPIPVATAAIQEAELHSMCQSVLIDEEIPFLPPVTLNLTAGTEGSPAEAETLIVDMNQMAGDAEFQNLDIGVNAPDMDQGPASEHAVRTSGMFGQQADSIVVNDLQQTAVSTHAGVFRLNDLSLHLEFGRNECF